MNIPTALSFCSLPLLLAGCLTTSAPPAPAPADYDAVLHPHYQAARTAIARGNTQSAKTKLKLSLQDNPIHADSHFLLASLLASEGDLDQAMVGFQRAVALDPSHAVARYNLGTAMLWRGQPMLAASQLEEALAVQPDHLPSYNNLGKAYFLLGLPELAAACFAEAVRLSPSNPVAGGNLAVLAKAVESPSQADNASAVPQPSAPAQPKPPAPPSLAGATTADAEEEASKAANLISLRELLRDLPHVSVEQRGERLVLSGWTRGPAERQVLERIIAGRQEVLDLTSDDVGDPNRMIEIDAIMFQISGLESQSVGHDFLRSIQVVAGYDANQSRVDSDESYGGIPTPATQMLSSTVDTLTTGWNFSAAIDYSVNIANATDQNVAFLARPHLTTLSGTPASFLAGGDIVFQVSGTTSGDIKPYPFGTSLEVTPTLLRSSTEDGIPLVRLVVKVGRKSVMPIESLEASSDGAAQPVSFSNVEVTSEAVLGLQQTLILTGMSQQERQKTKSGVPFLMSIPGLKYFFSNESVSITDTSIIILLTPRDPAFWSEQNRREFETFIDMRRALIRAMQGSEEDRRQFKARYPDWAKLPPNRFASHFILMKNSDVYRKISGRMLVDEPLDFEAVERLERK